MQPTTKYRLWTDASGTWGCGARFGDQWLQFHRPPEWTPITIMAKELVPIVLSCSILGKPLKQKNVQFFCDNLGLVESIQKGVSKDAVVMHLLRCLWFFTALYSIHITATHLPGVQNTEADLLSRNKLPGVRLPDCQSPSNCCKVSSKFSQVSPTLTKTLCFGLPAV